MAFPQLPKLPVFGARKFQRAPPSAGCVCARGARPGSWLAHDPPRRPRGCGSRLTGVGALGSSGPPRTLRVWFVAPWTRCSRGRGWGRGLRSALSPRFWGASSRSTDSEHADGGRVRGECFREPVKTAESSRLQSDVRLLLRRLGRGRGNRRSPRRWTVQRRVGGAWPCGTRRQVWGCRGDEPADRRRCAPPARGATTGPGARRWDGTGRASPRPGAAEPPGLDPARL